MKPGIVLRNRKRERGRDAWETGGPEAHRPMFVSHPGETVDVWSDAVKNNIPKDFRP